MHHQCRWNVSNSMVASEKKFTYTKNSPKMVNLRGKAGNIEEENETSTKLFEHHERGIWFHPEKSKCVPENEANNSAFHWPSDPQSHWKRNKMVEVNGAYKHARYERIWLIALKASATHDGWKDGLTRICKLVEHDWLHRSMCYLHG